jgi:integrase
MSNPIVASEINPARISVANATTGKRKVMAKRGQLGTITIQNGHYRLRIRSDSETGRVQRSIDLGKVGEINSAERLRKQLEVAAKYNSAEYLNKVCNTDDTFKKQAVKWLGSLRCKPATKASAISTLEYHVYPIIGDIPLSEVRNAELKEVVDAIAQKGLSLSMMQQAVKFTKMVKASALNEDLEPLYPYRFNLKAIFGDVDRSKYKTNQPCPLSSQVTAMIGKAQGWFRVFLILAASSGLRFGELLGLEIRHFTGDSIQVEQSIWRGSKQSPKTRNSVRVVDLHPDVAQAVRDYIGDRKEGFIFPVRHQGGITERLYKVQDDCGAARAGMHSFRRFRNTYLTNRTAVPRGLILAWMGWSSKSTMQDNYDKVDGDVAFRQLAAQSAGYGFALPVGEKVPSVPCVPCKTSEVAEKEVVVASCV